MQQSVLRRSGYVMRGPSTAFAAERDVGVGGRRNLPGITLDRSGARGAAKRRSVTIVADEKKGLSGIVRVRTWLAHELSSCFTALHGWRRLGDSLTAIH